MAVSIALGIAADGSRDVLGMWAAENESALGDGFQRAEGVRPRRHPDRRHRRHQGHGANPGGRILEERAPDVHRAPDLCLYRLHLAPGFPGLH